MNKADLVARIRDAVDVPRTIAEKAFASIIEGITEALVKGQTVNIVGLGTFSVKERAEKVGRNPKTREAITIPARKMPHFKAGTNLKKKVNRRGET